MKVGRPAPPHCFACPSAEGLRRLAYVVFLALCVASGPLRGGSSPPIARRGEPLFQVLARLQEQGLPLVFSTRLVSPGLLVEREPQSAEPGVALDELLAQHGLALARSRSGLLVITRRRAAADRPVSPPPSLHHFAEVIEVVPLVEVPVVVARAGKPVAGLGPEDFELREDGEVQTLVEVVRPSLTATPRAGTRQVGVEGEQAPGTVLFLFNTALSQPIQIDRAREAVGGYLERRSGPHDPKVGIAAYTQAGGLIVLQRRASASKATSAALATLPRLDLFETRSRPTAGGLAGMGKQRQKQTKGTAEDGGRDGENHEPSPRLTEMAETAVDIDALVARSERALDQGRALAVLEALEDAAALLAVEDGPKQVVLISEVVDDSLFFGRPEAILPSPDAFGPDTELGSFWRVDSTELFGSTTARTSLDRAARALVDSGVLLSVVHLGERQRAARRNDVLDWLARRTGSTAPLFGGDLEDQLAAAETDRGCIYLLRYQPTPWGPAETSRKLSVRLGDGPRRVKLVYPRVRTRRAGSPGGSAYR